MRKGVLRGEELLLSFEDFVVTGLTPFRHVALDARIELVALIRPAGGEIQPVEQLGS